MNKEIKKILSEHFSDVPMSQSEADNLIEKLNILLQQDKWISVEDELPKKNDYLIVFWRDSVLYGYWDSKTFQVVKGLGSFMNIKPTHWQPLPQPPKERLWIS